MVLCAILSLIDGCIHHVKLRGAGEVDSIAMLIKALLGKHTGDDSCPKCGQASNKLMIKVLSRLGQSRWIGGSLDSSAETEEERHAEGLASPGYRGPTEESDKIPREVHYRNC